MAVPLVFGAWCVAIGAWVLLLVFATPRVLGWLVTRALSRALGAGVHVRVGRMYATPIGGKLLFRDVVFAGTEVAGRAAAGSLTLRWWPGRVRAFGEPPSAATTAAHRRQQTPPCRVHVHLTGFEVLWFGHSQQQQQAATTTTTTMPSVRRFVLPGLYRLAPAVGLTVRTGCAMLGAPDLPTLTVLAFARAQGVHWTGPAALSDADYYRRTTQLELRHPRLRLLRNPDWVPGHELCRRPDPLRLLERVCGACCVDPDAEFRSDVARQRVQRRPEDGPNKQPLRTELYAEQDMALGARVLQCKSASVAYYEDVPGPVTAAMARAAFKPDMAPQWGVDLTLRATKMAYGPWADRQRALLFGFLFPQDFARAEAPKLVEGTPRPFAEFRLAAKFEQTVELAVPFRDPSGPTPPASAEVAHESITLTCEGLSKVEFCFDLVSPTGQGYRSVFAADLSHCSAVTSINNKPLLAADTLALALVVRSPAIFNEVRRWDCKLSAHTAQAFFLYDHVLLFQRLVADLFVSDREPTYLDSYYTSPSEVTFAIEAEDAACFFNANEGNVIHAPNDLDENVHFVLTVPRISVLLKMPFLPCHAATRDVVFEVSASKGCFSLLLPAFDTNRQLFSASESNISWRNTGSVPGVDPPQRVLGIPFVWADSASIKGSYHYYLTYRPDFLDSLTLDIAAGPGDLQLFGFFLAHILSFQANYLGVSRHVASSPGQIFPEEAPSTPLEVFLALKVTGANVRLPVGLYRSRPCVSAMFETMLLEFRYLPTYIDLSICVSPAAVKIPVATSEYDTPICHSFDLKAKELVTVSGFSFDLHYMLGPQPDASSYRETYRIKIGTIYGNCLVAQLLSLATFAEHFVYSFGNKDNKAVARVWPKNRIFVTFSAELGAAALYLWSGSGVTLVEAESGASAVLNTFVTHIHNAKARISVPRFSVRQFIPNDGLTSTFADLKEWTEVGAFRFAAGISLYVRDPTWQEDSAEQLRFLKTQDAETHRLSFLWDGLDTPSPRALRTSHLELVSPRGEKSDPQAASSSSVAVAAVAEEEEKPLQDSPEVAAPAATATTATTKTTLPRAASTGLGESAWLTEEEEEEDEFKTAHSNAFSDGEPETEEEEDDDDEHGEEAERVVERAEEGDARSDGGYEDRDGGTTEPPTVTQESHESPANTGHLLLRAAIVDHCEFVEGLEPLAIETSIPLRAFSSGRDAGVSFSSEREGPCLPKSSLGFLNTEAPPARSALKGSKSSSRKTVGKSKQRPRHRAHRAAEKAGSLKSQLHTLHQHSASTVTIVFDSLSDVSILLTPLALGVVSGLLESLLLKMATKDDLIDSLQMKIIDRAFPSAQHTHERVQILASFDSITLRSFNIEGRLSERGTNVSVSKTKVSGVRLYFSICKKYTFPKDARPLPPPTAAPTSSILNDFLDRGVPKEELCSVSGALSAESAVCCFSTITSENAERMLAGRMLASETIDEILGAEGDKDLLLSIGCVTASLCSRHIADVSAPEQDIEVSVDGADLRTSNDMGFVLSVSAVPWVTPLAKLLNTASELSAFRETLTRAFLLDALGKLPGMLHQQPAPDTTPTAEVFSLSSFAILHRRSWRELALLRHLLGRDFESAPLKRVWANYEAAFELEDARIRTQFKALEEAVASRLSDTQLSTQIQAIVRSPPVIALFLSEDGLLRTVADVNVKASLFSLSAVFVKQHYETKISCRQLSVLSNIILQHGVQKATLAVVLDDTSINFGPSIFGIAQGFITFAEDVKKALVANKKPRKKHSREATRSAGLFPASLDAKLSLSSLKCHVASSQFGTLLVHLRSANVSHCSFPSEQHSTLGFLSLLSLDLADSATVSATRSQAAQPCITLSIKNTVVSEALAEAGGGSKSCDVSVHADSVDGGFTVSEKFLAKLQGFVKEWGAAIRQAVLALGGTAASGLDAASSSSSPSSSSLPTLLSGSLDVGSLQLGSDIIASLPFRFETKRLFASVSQSSLEHIEMMAQLLEHRLVFTMKEPEALPSSSEGPKTRFLQMPSLRLVSLIEHPPRKGAKLDGKIDVGAWRNTIDAELISNIIALQWRMKREIDDALEMVTRFQQARKLKIGVSPRVSTSQGFSSNLRWDLELNLAGIDVTAESPAASINMLSGKVRISLRDAPPSPGTLVPFSWSLSVTGFAITVLDPASRSEAWTRVRTDVSLRNHKGSSSRAHSHRRHKHADSSSAASATALAADQKHDSMWLSISNTQVVMQPGALEKAAALWLHYLGAVVDIRAHLGSLVTVDKHKLRQAFTTVAVTVTPSTDELAQHSASLEVRIRDFALLLPFRFPAEGSPGAALTLSEAKLLGRLSKKFLCDLARLGKASAARKILGSCSFKELAFSFVDDCSLELRDLLLLPRSKSTTHVCSTIEQGQCSVVLVLSALFSVISAELDSTGPTVVLNAKLVQYVRAISESITENQRRLMKVVDIVAKKQGTGMPQQQQQQQDAPQHHSQYGMIADVKMRLRPGRLDVAKLPKGAGTTVLFPPRSSFGFNPAAVAGDRLSLELPSFFATLGYSFLPSSPESVDTRYAAKTDIGLFLNDISVVLSPLFAVVAEEFAAQLRYKSDDAADRDSASSSTSLSTTTTTPAPATANLEEMEEADAQKPPSIINIIAQSGTLSIELNCDPFSSSVCRVALEPVDAFCSISVQASPSVSLLVNAPSATVRVHHVQFPDQSTWARASCANLNYTTAFHPLGVALAYVGDISCGLNIDRVNEFGEFYRIWLLPLTEHGSSLSARRPPKPEAPETSRPLNTLLDFGVTTATASLELGQWIGHVLVEAKRFGLGFGVVPHSDSSTGMSVHGKLKTLALTSKGRLSGAIKSNGFFASVDVNGGQPLCEAIAVVNPLETSFEYSLIPVLSFRSRGGTATLLARGPETPVSTHFDVQGVDLQLCPETIATAMTVTKKLSALISEQFAFLSADGQQATPRTLLVDSPRASMLCNGDIGVKISGINVWISEGLRDSVWFDVSTQSAMLVLKITEGDSVAGLSRDLVLEAAQVVLCVDTEKRHRSKKRSAAGDTWKRTKTQAKVVEMPIGRLLMRTLQHVPTELEFWFETAFDKPIFVSLDISLYAQLRELVGHFDTRISEEMQRLTAAATPAAGAHSPSPAAAASPLRTQRPRPTFKRHSFVLEPELSVLSDLTPPVSKVLGWAGIESPSTSIPKVLHGSLTEALEGPLRAACELWNGISLKLGPTKK